MSEAITLPAPVIQFPPLPEGKWAREYLAFRQLVPQLLTTHRGLFVAVHDGKVVDAGDDKLAVALRTLAKVGNVAIHVGLVSDEPEPISRSGIRREIRSVGDVQ